MVVGCGPACGGTGCGFGAGCEAGCGVGVVASGVAGADIWTGAELGCESAGCCATALTDSSKVTIQIKVRITLISVFLQCQFFSTPTGKQRVRPRWNPPADHCAELV